MMEWLLNIQQAGGAERSGLGVVVQAVLWRRTRAALSVSTLSGRNLVLVPCLGLYLSFQEQSFTSLISDCLNVKRAWLSQYTVHVSHLVQHFLRREKRRNTCSSWSPPAGGEHPSSPILLPHPRPLFFFFFTITASN